MKKILIFILIFIFLVNPTYATNTYAVDVATTQYLSIADASQTGLDLNSDFSVCWWQKLDTTTGSHGIFGRASLLPYALYWSGNVIRIGLDADCTAGGNITCDLATNQSSDWHHYCVLHDLSAKTAYLYVDGSSATNCNSASFPTSLPNCTSVVYVTANATLSWSDGKFDDMRVYSDMLTSTEITDTYNCSLTGGAGDPDNLVAQWELENNYLDTTANNNDLTNSSTNFYNTTLPYTNTCAGGAVATPERRKANQPQMITF